ncbi:hypothetical protein FUAX_22700 [Fulvitalea axinellae]|uniref:Uncharacterized protein n=1 Tax=Fulvitalea axinellae TaxID=1182444 RepID=A0AAU9CIF2_9BACT|nr:hypothetical protein FUAX_22700 [Fulvitalea axinellae]
MIQLWGKDKAQTSVNFGTFAGQKGISKLPPPPGFGSVAQCAGHAKDFHMLESREWIIKRIDPLEAREYASFKLEGRHDGVIPRFFGPYEDADELFSDHTNGVALTGKDREAVGALSAYKGPGDKLIILSNVTRNKKDSILRDIKIGRQTANYKDQKVRGVGKKEAKLKVTQHELMDRVSGSKSRGFRDEDQWKKVKGGNNLGPLRKMLKSVSPECLSVLVKRLGDIYASLAQGRTAYVGASVLLVINPDPGFCDAVMIDFAHPVTMGVHGAKYYNPAWEGMLFGLANLRDYVQAILQKKERRAVESSPRIRLRSSGGKGKVGVSPTSSFTFMSPGEMEEQSRPEEVSLHASLAQHQMSLRSQATTGGGGESDGEEEMAPSSIRSRMEPERWSLSSGSSVEEEGEQSIPRKASFFADAFEFMVGEAVEEMNFGPETVIYQRVLQSLKEYDLIQGYHGVGPLHARMAKLFEIEHLVYRWHHDLGGKTADASGSSISSLSIVMFRMLELLQKEHRQVVNVIIDQGLPIWLPKGVQGGQGLWEQSVAMNGQMSIAQKDMDDPEFLWRVNALHAKLLTTQTGQNLLGQVFAVPPKKRITIASPPETVFEDSPDDTAIHIHNMADAKVQHKDNPKKRRAGKGSDVTVHLPDESNFVDVDPITRGGPSLAGMYKQDLPDEWEFVSEGSIGGTGAGIVSPGASLASQPSVRPKGKRIMVPSFVRYARGLEQAILASNGEQRSQFESEYRYGMSPLGMNDFERRSILNQMEMALRSEHQLPNNPIAGGIEATDGASVERAQPDWTMLSYIDPERSLGFPFWEEK